MTIPIPSGMTRGRVSWRIGHDRAGSTLPGASGTVRFEPTALAVAYTDATVLMESVETPVIGGVMTPVDLQVNDPDIWNWKVQPRVGVTWEPFHVDVPGPVDLATAAVVPGIGPVRAVKGEKGDTPTWGDLPGKPTTFPPAAHQHTLADVDGLTARLAALEYNSGRRDVSSLISGATGVYLHRVGQLVTWDWVSATFPAGAWRVLCTVPVGFRPVSEVLAVAHGASSPSALDGTRSSARITTTLTADVTAGPRYRLQVSYFTADSTPAPTALPGSPA
ncbi:hypothetical protein M3G50_07295 [Brachybacterium muris]|uniref:hypothetical protein n=1 Tax=Brachybacterium muris TaxID=219301 RepID=UPI0021A83ADF|nr:hypothetical protein [Brachybacterium muris]MCT1430557.1 hypothetical protein [Brachybacterium muris]